jgi:hypothetical protein
MTTTHYGVFLTALAAPAAGDHAILLATAATVALQAAAIGCFLAGHRPPEA